MFPIFIALLCLAVPPRDTSAIDTALDLARSFESLELNPYYDPAGFLTIGYGHKLSSRQWSPLPPGLQITKEGAERILKADMEVAVQDVTRLVTVHLSSEKKAALFDFTFNLGGHNLSASSLLYVINQGHCNLAPDQFRKWVHVHGAVEAGLVKRREAEVKLWLKGEGCGG